MPKIGGGLKGSKPFVVEERGGIERRQQPRANIAVPIHLKHPDLDSVFASDALNISKGGMFITMQSPPAVGSTIDVELSVNDRGLILHAECEVMRRVDGGPESGVGVRFVNISYEAQALIDRMLADEKMFGDYRLEALVGRGGMAEVYRARDLTSADAGRKVALKRILPELADNNFIGRLFEREAIVTRALQHPNIVEVYDVGKVGGTYYIAMEYVEGSNLGQMVTACGARSIHIPVDFACYTGQIIAEALHHAHIANDASGGPLGIVHRDVTPSNVFVSHLGEIKLGDFGVAVSKYSEPEKKGSLAGKDPYLAPELLDGAPASAASDVFSLGVTLYETITNRRPFDGDTAEEIHDSIRQTPPEPLSYWRREVPEAVDAVVNRALAPRPPNVGGGLLPKLSSLKHRNIEPRYGSAAELAEVLSKVYNPELGNQMAIASVVRGLFGPEPPRA